MDAVTCASFAPRSRSSSPRASSSSIAADEPLDLLVRRAPSRARTARAAPCWRISFAHARPMPAIARWSRRNECSRRESARRISPSRSAPTPSASGPRCASSCLGRLGRQQPDAGALLRAGLGQDELARRPRTAAGTPASSALSRRAADSAGVRRSSGGRAGRARRPRSGTAAACRAARRRRGAGPRAPTAAGRTSSASRCAPGRPARSGTRAPGRRARAASASISGSSGTYAPAHGPDQGNRAPRGAWSRRVHRVHAVAVAGRADRRVAPATRSSSPSSARPRSRSRRCRSRASADDVDRRRARDRLRVAPRRAGAARGRRRACSRRRRRPRTTSSAARRRAAEPSQLAHNCSGKHAGFLAVCHARGWPTEGYRLADHPMQQLLASARSPTRRRCSPDEIPAAVDGCGVLTFALTLERMAYSFSRLASSRAATRSPPR